MEKLHNCAKKVALHCHRNDTSYNKKRIETGFKRSRYFQQRRYCEGTQVQFPYPAVKHDQCVGSYLEQKNKCAQRFVATYVKNKADKSLCRWVGQSQRDLSGLLFEKFHPCFGFLVCTKLFDWSKKTHTSKPSRHSLRLYNLTSHWILLNSSKFFLFLLSFSKYAEAKLCAKNETLKSCKVTPQLQDDVDFIYDEFNPFCSKRKDPQERILRKKPSRQPRRSPVQDVEEKIRPSRGNKIPSKVSILVAILCSVLSIVS